MHHANFKRVFETMNNRFVELMEAAKDVVKHPRSAKKLAQLEYLTCHKRCRNCNLLRPVDEFGKSEQYFDGLRPVCNHCRRKNRGKM